MRGAVIRLFLALLFGGAVAACDAAPAPTDTNPLWLDASDPLERGRYLARAGGCVACHTRPGAAEYSGGRAIDTPFGAIYSSNLTSDEASGLGAWSADDFWQAMHHGRSRDGRELYPAFPYPSYTLVTRDDSDALFAYLRTIPAVSAHPPDHELRFPFDTRLALRAWRWLFFEPRSFEADADRDESWNRGAYLVRGLGHCGACHTPRGALGNAQADRELSGAHVEGLGWDAPSLATGPSSPQGKRGLVTLLKSGVNERDTLSGPMAEVTLHGLQYLTDEHLGDMIEYLAGLPVAPAPPPTSSSLSAVAAERLREEGGAIYGEHCSDCHGDGGRGEPFRYPALAANRGVTAASANNALRMVKRGGFGASTAARPEPHGMPAYAHRLDARQAAAVISYIRGAWGNAASAVSPRDWERD